MQTVDESFLGTWTDGEPVLSRGRDRQSDETSRTNFGTRLDVNELPDGRSARCRQALGISVSRGKGTPDPSLRVRDGVRVNRESATARCRQHQLEEQRTSNRPAIELALGRSYDPLSGRIFDRHMDG